MEPGEQAVDVEYLQGIHVTDSVLWLDALRRSDLCFLSHAHVEPSDPHRKILCTEATAALVRHRMGGVPVLVSPYRRRFSLGQLDLELHPAGHMPGAAQIAIERGGVRLVYTGHFLPEPTRTAQAGEVLSCDVLVTGASGAGWTLPPRQRVEAALVAWCQSTLAEGAQPVLLAAPLGMAQELVALLGAHGLPARVHGSIHRYCRIYRGLGIALPKARRFSERLAPGETLVFPRGLRASPTLAKLRRPRLAVVEAQAVEPGHAGRLGVDAAFALSLRADRPALLRTIRASGAGTVYLTGSQAGGLARELRREGLRAWRLHPPEQMDFFRQPPGASS